MTKQKLKKLKKYQKPKITVQKLYSKLYRHNFGGFSNPENQDFMDQFLLAAAHCLDSY